ncbi:MAG: hypothetical protein ABIP96_05760 [Patescibacteria group bacterium]
MRRSTFALLLLIALPSVLRASAARAEDPHPPSFASVSVSRTGVFLSFNWTSASKPNFPANTTVEFEVHIDPKCFTQPIGGKDDNKSLVGVPNNFPSSAEPYRDVWNYWTPPTTDGIILEIQDHCNNGNPLALEIDLGLRHWLSTNTIADKNGNFSVGVRNAAALNSDYSNHVNYWFYLPTEIPIDEKCTSEGVLPIDGDEGYVSERVVLRPDVGPGRQQAILLFRWQQFRVYTGVLLRRLPAKRSLPR